MLCLQWIASFFLNYDISLYVYELNLAMVMYNNKKSVNTLGDLLAIYYPW